ncbi:MAG: hypothetical protein ABIE36_01695 [Candidatus Diapherotrites archaeon]
METKRSEKYLMRLNRARKLAWFGFIILAFDFVFWMAFVESTTEYPPWTRDICIGISVIGVIFLISALIILVHAQMYD